MVEKLQDVKQIELTAKITLDMFKNDQGEELAFASTVIPDPFGDEDFLNVPITPKWKDAEIMFKFHAKKALRTSPVVEFPITIKPLSYKNKKNKTVTYPGIVGIDPFDGREKEFRVKIGKDKNVFDDTKSVIFNNLARRALGMEPEEIDE